jgi:type VI secretion system secreted protein VgrG
MFAALHAHAGGVPLGSAENFAVLGGSTVTNTGSSTVFGSVGVSPGTAIVGILRSAVTGGTIEAGGPVAAAAHADAMTAYNDFAALPVSATLSDQDLGGMTLLPGVYVFGSSAGLTGTLTLDADGQPNATFVFQIGSTLTTSTASAVNVINGTSGCVVVWQVGSSATLGVNTAFTGTIIAAASITLNTNASVLGRAIALDGAVTMDNNHVTIEDICSCVSAGPDFNQDGLVDGADLGHLLGAWGSNDCQSDQNGDGVVDGADLGMLLGSWSI